MALSDCGIALVYVHTHHGVAREDSVDELLNDCLDALINMLESRRPSVRYVVGQTEPSIGYDGKEFDGTITVGSLRIYIDVEEV